MVELLVEMEMVEIVGVDVFEEVVVVDMQGVEDLPIIWRHAMATSTACPPYRLMTSMSSASCIWVSSIFALVSTSSKKSSSNDLSNCFFVASISRTFVLIKRSLAQDWKVSSPSSNSLLNCTKRSEATTSGSREVRVRLNRTEDGGASFSVRDL